MSEMNDETFALRRKVMNVLYEIKKRGFNLPRIEVRILDHTEACAYAYLGKNICHFNRKYMIPKYESLFVQIVLHEVIHATFGVGEVIGCRLMHCTKFWQNRPTEAEAWELFEKYYKAYKS
jgi:predicted SprT family Zn-dependent metalloprotease